MTNQFPTHPGPPAWQPPSQPPPKPPKGKPFYKRPWPYILVAALLLFGGCTIGVLGAIGSAVDEAADTADVTIKQATPTTANQPDPIEEPEPPTPHYDTPAKADFKLTVKELNRDRYGSAGDSVEYRVNLTQVRDRTYDPDKEYELTFKVSGIEDGSERHTMLVRGDEFEPYEGFDSTRSGVKITASILSIEEI